MPGSRLAGEHLKHDRDIWQLGGVEKTLQIKEKNVLNNWCIVNCSIAQMQVLPSEVEAGTNSSSEQVDFQLWRLESSCWCQMFVFQRRGAVEKQVLTRKLLVLMFWGFSSFFHVVLIISLVSKCVHASTDIILSTDTFSYLQNMCNDLLCLRSSTLLSFHTEPPNTLNILTWPTIPDTSIGTSRGLMESSIFFSLNMYCNFIFFSVRLASLVTAGTLVTLHSVPHVYVKTTTVPTCCEIQLKLLTSDTQKYNLQVLKLYSLLQLWQTEIWDFKQHFPPERCSFISLHVPLTMISSVHRWPLLCKMTLHQCCIWRTEVMFNPRAPLSGSTAVLPEGAEITTRQTCAMFWLCLLSVTEK